jgi:hypothetical protein
MSKEGVKLTQEYRKQGKRVKLEERDGVAGKECTKCKVWKPLVEEFHRNKKGLGERSQVCKLCTRQWNTENRDYYSNWHLENRERRLVDRKTRYKDNREHELLVNRRWEEANKESARLYRKKWVDENRDRVRAVKLRRRAKENVLPSGFSYRDIELLKSKFNGCALTQSEDIHWDHAIPLAVGHGGSVLRNMIPLRSDLNLSKNDANIFKWFEANRQRFELSQERFDNLIDWLASANAMTVDEYRDYVYWCHENPRDLNEGVNA